MMKLYQTFGVTLFAIYVIACSESKFVSSFGEGKKQSSSSGISEDSKPTKTSPEETDKNAQVLASSNQGSEPGEEPTMDPSPSPSPSLTPVPTQPPLLAECQRLADKKITLDFPVLFPENTKECAWEANGNGKPRQGRFRARHETKVMKNVVLPPGAVICKFELNEVRGAGSTGYFSYDDEIMLTINDHLLFASNWELVQKLGSKSTFNASLPEKIPAEILDFSLAKYDNSAALFREKILDVKERHAPKQVCMGTKVTKPKGCEFNPAAMLSDVERLGNNEISGSPVTTYCTKEEAPQYLKKEFPSGLQVAVSSVRVEHATGGTCTLPETQSTGLLSVKLPPEVTVPILASMTSNPSDIKFNLIVFGDNNGLIAKTNYPKISGGPIADQVDPGNPDTTSVPDPENPGSNLNVQRNDCYHSELNTSIKIEYVVK